MKPKDRASRSTNVKHLPEYYLVGVKVGWGCGSTFVFATVDVEIVHVCGAVIVLLGDNERAILGLVDLAFEDAEKTMV